MFNHDPRFLHETERKFARRIFHAVSLGGGAVMAPACIALKYKIDTDEVEASIKDLEQQQAASKDGTTFIISEHARDIAEFDNVKTLTPVATDTLTTSTHAELLEPLYQKRDELHNTIDGGIVAASIGLSVAFAYFTNAASIALGYDDLYVNGGIALAERASKNKHRMNR